MGACSRAQRTPFCPPCLPPATPRNCTFWHSTCAPQGTPNQTGRSVDLFYYLTRSLRPRSEVILRYHVVETGPDFFHSFLAYNESYLEYLSEKSYVMDTEVENSLYTVWLRLDAHYAMEHRQKQTLLDLVGSWGALFGSVTSALSIIGLAVNEWLFYKKVCAVSSGRGGTVGRGGGERRGGFCQIGQQDEAGLLPYAFRLPPQHEGKTAECVREIRVGEIVKTKCPRTKGGRGQPPVLPYGTQGVPCCPSDHA